VGPAAQAAPDEAEPATRVVVVDDDEASLRLLGAILERDGCEVRSHRDATAAYDDMRRAPPDVLVADWVMPEVDGPELLRKVRATPDLQATYCVLVTAHDFRGKKVAGLLLGADDYLAKPVSETELVARVRVGVRVRRLERSASLLAMAATLGHEINNPLTGVLGYVELLRGHLKKGETARAEDAAVRIQASAERIRDVVKRLLALRDPRLKRYSTGKFMLDLGGPGEAGGAAPGGPTAP